MRENDEAPRLEVSELLCWQIRTRQAMPATHAEAAKVYEGDGKPFPFFYRTKNGHVFVCLRQIGREKWDEFVKGLLEREPEPGVIVETP